MGKENGNIDKYKDLQTLNTDEITKYDLMWILPKDIFPVQWRYQNSIYNFVLDAYHTINVNGSWCCTLGHDYKGKIIQHEFLGKFSCD